MSIITSLPYISSQKKPLFPKPLSSFYPILPRYKATSNLNRSMRQEEPKSHTVVVPSGGSPKHNVSASPMSQHTAIPPTPLAHRPNPSRFQSVPGKTASPRDPKNLGTLPRCFPKLLGTGISPSFGEGAGKPPL